MGSLSRTSGLTVPRLQPGDTWQSAYRRLAEAVEHLIRDNQLPIRWDDQQVTIGSVRIPASGGASWGVYQGGPCLEFSGSQDNLIYFTAQNSHTTCITEPVEFHIHIVPEDTAAGNVFWRFTHSWAGIGSAFPSATPVDVVLATPGAVVHTVDEIVATINPPAGNTVSSILLCSLERRASSEATDTYNSKLIRMVALDFHTARDTNRGSQLEAAKWDR